MIPEKPCKVMEPESISHLGWRNWGGNEGGYGVPGPGADMGWWGPTQPASASMRS